MLRIEAINADRDQLGEGPLWDVEEQALYWIDSFAPAVFRLDPKGGRRRWAMPERVGSIAIRRGGGGASTPPPSACWRRWPGPMPGRRAPITSWAWRGRDRATGRAASRRCATRCR